MTDKMKEKIIDAVNEVYERTDELGMLEYTKDVVLTVPGFLRNREETISISRNRFKRDPYYELYTKHNPEPLLTVYGCWPVEYVSDIFIRAMEHFYGIY